MSRLVFKLVFIILLLGSSLISEELYNLHTSTTAYSTQIRTAYQTASKRVEDLIGWRLQYKPDIWLVTEQAEFDSLIGGGLPDWSAAVAVPAFRTIVLKSPDHFNVQKSLTELIIHEYSHLALADRSRFGKTPRWFDEGFAMLVSTEWGWSDNIAMNRASLFGQIIPLRDIDNVNRFRSNTAEVAYAESYLAVKYMFEAYSREAVIIFLDSIRERSSIDNALIAATGSNYNDFEAEFRLYLEKQFNILSLFVDTMWLWITLALIVVVGAILNYRRRKEVYRRWEQEEQLHSTDFDYGDPDNPEKTDDDEPWQV